jgi:hypothetical protein
MATIVQTVDLPERIRVALIIEAGRIKPVWFEQVDSRSRDRIFIKEVCSTIQHMEGSTRIISFSVWDGANSYRLSLNTRDFTWRLGIAQYSNYR